MVHHVFDEIELMSLRRAAELIGVTRSTLVDLLSRSKTARTIRVRTQTRVSYGSLRALVNELEGAAQEQRERLLTKAREAV